MPKLFIRSGGFIALLFVAATLVMTLGAWVTHVVFTIKASSWLLLLAGGLIFPIGIIHGWMIWLGVVL